MNNIQKAFKDKRNLGLGAAVRMAGGGVIDGMQGGAMDRIVPTGNMNGGDYAAMKPTAAGSPAYVQAMEGLQAQADQQKAAEDFTKKNTPYGSDLGANYQWKTLGNTPAGPSPFYKAGSAEDPHGAGFLPANPKPMNRPVQTRTPMPTTMQEQDILGRSKGLTTLQDAQRTPMADGGILPVADTIRSRGAQIAAAANYDAPAPVAAAPTPVAPAAPSQAGDYAAQAAQMEADSLAAARAKALPPKPKGFLSRIGFKDAGVVQGEGTRTSDSVPAQVGEGQNKQKLALSKGEGLLVVSNNTMDNPEAMEAIKNILTESNGGKEPKMPEQGLRGAVRAASGAIIEPEGWVSATGARLPYDLNLQDTRTVPQQDGVVTGQKVAPELTKPNFTQPRQMPVPVREVIEGSATRVPETTAMVPAGGATPRTERVGNTGPEVVPEAAKPNWTTPQSRALVPMQPVAAEVPPPKAPGYFDKVKEGMKSRDVGEAVGDAGESLKNAVKSTGEALAKSKTATFVGRNGMRVLKGAPYVAAGMDATDIADVATDPNKTKLDVVEQGARTAGRWGSAGVGAKLGAAASMPIAPFAGPFAPAVPVVGGLIGGAAGYLGADALMDWGSGKQAPDRTSYGAVKKSVGMDDPNNPRAVSPSKGTVVPIASVQGTPASGAATTTPVTPVSPEAEAGVKNAATQKSTTMADNTVAFGQKQAGLRGGSNAQFNADTMLRGIANNEAVRSTMNASHDQRGDGISYDTTTSQSTGKPQTMITGVGNTKTEPVPKEALDAYGNDTRVTKQLQGELRNARRERYESEATAVNPAYHERGKTGLAAMLGEDQVSGANRAKMAEAQIRGLEWQRGLSNDKRDQANKDRDVENAQGELHTKHVEDFIRSATVDAEGKPSGVSEAAMRRYAGNFPKTKNMTADQHSNALSSNYALDKAIESLGRHYLTKETPWDGEVSKFEKQPVSMSDRVLHGVGVSKYKYVDPQTKRTIYDWDIENTLSPDQRDIFKKERIINK